MVASLFRLRGQMYLGLENKVWGTEDNYMQTKSHLLCTQGKTNHAHNSKMPFFVAAFTRREKKNETIKQFLQNIIGMGIAAPELKTYEIKRTVRCKEKHH